MLPFKWHKISEILPENTDLCNGENQVKGQFVVCLANTNAYIATRCIDLFSGKWYWEFDSDDLNNWIKQSDLEYWMLITTPEE